MYTDEENTHDNAPFTVYDYLAVMAANDNIDVEYVRRMSVYPEHAEACAILLDNIAQFKRRALTLVQGKYYGNDD